MRGLKLPYKFAERHLILKIYGVSKIGDLYLSYIWHYFFIIY